MITQTAYKDFSSGIVGNKELLAFIQTVSDPSTPVETIILPADARGYVIVTILAAETAGSTYGIVGRKLIHWKTSAGVSSIVSSDDIIPDSLDGLTTATWDVNATGGDLVIAVTGETGRTIDWYALYDNNYINLSPP